MDFVLRSKGSAMNASVYCAHCGALNQPQAVTCFACSRSLDEPAPAAIDARRLIHGRYRLVRQLGVGGFGAVYQAEDTTLGNRLVAVKEMSPRGLSPEEAKEATDAFQQEALLLAGLAHPSLPRIYERFEEEGRWYLVMDFIEGETLEVYLDKQGGTLPVKEALGLALQLTEVLSYLHSRQPPIIFRDLKPSNIIRSADGQVTLVDFGIARFFKPGQSKDTIAFGSPGYAAPEQYGKAQTTPRSDIFSLGAVLHQMLTGIDPSEKPFRFAPLTMPRPAGLSGLIGLMVKMDESKRPRSMEVIKRELTALLDVPSTSWRDDELSLTGASISPPGTSIGSWTATGPVVTPAGYSGPPIQTLQGSAAPQPTQKKKGKAGCLVGLAVAAFLIWQIVSGVTSHSTATSSTNTDTTLPGSNVTATATPAGTGITVYSVAWSPDGAQVASGGVDGKIALWNATTGALILTLNTEFAEVNMVAWSPNGSLIAAVGNKSELQIWNSNDGTSYATYKIASSGIAALSWSPDNEHIALAGGDSTVRIVDVLNGSFSLFAQSSHGVNAVAWSPNGQYLAFGGVDWTVQVWDYAQDTVAFTYLGHSGAIDAIAWSPDGTRIASTGGDGTIQVWDALTGANTFTYTNVTGIALAWSPNGQYLASSEYYGYAKVWEMNDADPIFVFAQQYAAYSYSVAWSPDSKQIASSGYNGTIQMWDALTGAIFVTCWQP
jgi:WD40 repeat protein